MLITIIKQDAYEALTKTIQFVTVNKTNHLADAVPHEFGHAFSSLIAENSSDDSPYTPLHYREEFVETLENEYLNLPENFIQTIRSKENNLEYNYFNLTEEGTFLGGRFQPEVWTELFCAQYLGGGLLNKDDMLRLFPKSAKVVKQQVEEFCKNSVMN